MLLKAGATETRPSQLILHFAVRWPDELPAEPVRTSQLPPFVFASSSLPRLHWRTASSSRYCVLRAPFFHPRALVSRLGCVPFDPSLCSHPPSPFPVYAFPPFLLFSFRLIFASPSRAPISILAFSLFPFSCVLSSRACAQQRAASGVFPWQRFLGEATDSKGAKGQRARFKGTGREGTRADAPPVARS